MAATAWTFYNKAKQKIGDGTIQLDAGVPRMSLHTSASNASTQTFSLYGQLNGEIVAQGGYAARGDALAGVVWSLSASTVVWDATDLVFTASGANLSNVKFAVIAFSAATNTGHLLCWSRLSTSQFSVSSGNTLTVQFATAGIFTLN